MKRINFPERKKMWTSTEVQDWLDTKVDNLNDEAGVSNINWEKVANQQMGIIQKLKDELAYVKKEVNRIANSNTSLTQLTSYRKEKEDRCVELLKIQRIKLSGMVSQRDRLIAVAGGMENSEVRKIVHGKTRRGNAKPQPIEWIASSVMPPVLEPGKAD